MNGSGTWLRGGCGRVEDQEAVHTSGAAHGVTDVGCLVVQDQRLFEACKSKAQRDHSLRYRAGFLGASLVIVAMDVEGEVFQIHGGM